MEKARGNELPDQRDTTNLWRAWAHEGFLGLLFPFALLLKLDHCLTRSIHSGREGKVLKVSLMHFTTLSMDLAVVMVTFFKTTNWYFHPCSTLERKSENRELCIQRNLTRAGFSLLLPWYTSCSVEQSCPIFQTFHYNAWVSIIPGRAELSHIFPLSVVGSSWEQNKPSSCTGGNPQLERLGRQARLEGAQWSLAGSPEKAEPLAQKAGGGRGWGGWSIFLSSMVFPPVTVF